MRKSIGTLFAALLGVSALAVLNKDILTILTSAKLAAIIGLSCLVLAVVLCWAAFFTNRKLCVFLSGLLFGAASVMPYSTDTNFIIVSLICYIAGVCALLGCIFMLEREIQAVENSSSIADAQKQAKEIIRAAEARAAAIVNGANQNAPHNAHTSPEKNKSTVQEKYQQELKAKRLEREALARQREIERNERIAKEKETFQKMIDNLPQYTVEIDDAPMPKRSVAEADSQDFTNITSKTNLEKLGNFVGIDVETTGLNPAQNEIVSIVAIRFRNFKPVEKFETLCFPQKGINPEAQKVNNITPEMVEGKPLFGQVVRSLSAFIGNENIVAHNLHFDLRFVVKHGFELEESKRKYYDTLEIAQRTIKKAKQKWDKELECMMPDENSFGIYDYKLPTLCAWYGIPYYDAHTAAADCIVLGALLQNLANDKMKSQ